MSVLDKCTLTLPKPFIGQCEETTDTAGATLVNGQLDSHLENLLRRREGPSMFAETSTSESSLLSGQCLSLSFSCVNKVFIWHILG